MASSNLHEVLKSNEFCNIVQRFVVEKIEIEGIRVKDLQVRVTDSINSFSTDITIACQFYGDWEWTHSKVTLTGKETALIKEEHIEDYLRAIIDRMAYEIISTYKGRFEPLVRACNKALDTISSSFGITPPESETDDYYLEYLRRRDPTSMMGRYYGKWQ